MHKLHVDLTGPHNRSKNGFTYLLTAICSFTKYLILVPLRDKTALAVARALVKNVYLVYGTPEIQMSDQGREFINELSDNLAKLLGIQSAKTTAYRPSSNGVIERTHRTLNSMFAKMVRETQSDW
jgi:transposase InsO family protein